MPRVQSPLTVEPLLRERKIRVARGLYSQVFQCKAPKAVSLYFLKRYPDDLYTLGLIEENIHFAEMITVKIHV